MYLWAIYIFRRSVCRGPIMVTITITITWSQSLTHTVHECRSWEWRNFWYSLSVVVEVKVCVLFSGSTILKTGGSSTRRKLLKRTKSTHHLSPSGISTFRTLFCLSETGQKTFFAHFLLQKAASYGLVIQMWTIFEFGFLIREDIWFRKRWVHCKKRFVIFLSPAGTLRVWLVTSRLGTGT